MTCAVAPIKPPFPWFGGKRKVAAEVWSRFGDVPNYVEPFAGGLAVMLARPTPPRTETINDLNCYVSNFWRAAKNDPNEVARWCDYPVSEIDLHARHQWLVDNVDFKERMRSDPDYFDAKVAGWCVWGLCQWIGGGWCDKQPGEKVSNQIPKIIKGGYGIHMKTFNSTEAFGRISARLRRTRIICGDWMRVLKNSATTSHGLSAVFLDPPYAGFEHYYQKNATPVSSAVREWAVAHGDDPLFRIALCGYEGEHEMPDGWECFSWTASGGHANRNATGNANRHKERIWFSPHCLKNGDVSLC